VGRLFFLGVFFLGIDLAGPARQADVRETVSLQILCFSAPLAGQAGNHKITCFGPTVL